uniref:Secreted protein n=1 Tax=Sus scrofa TaxID=9823 RepID=A0A8D0NU81_PIG
MAVLHVAGAVTCATAVAMPDPQPTLPQREPQGHPFKWLHFGCSARREEVTQNSAKETDN